MRCSNAAHCIIVLICYEFCRRRLKSPVYIFLVTCIADFGEWLELFTLGMTAGQTVESEYGETACPVCGAKAIYHDRNRIRCAECSYNTADTYMGRRLTPALTRQLLTFLHTSEVKGLRDADGRRFASVLVLEPISDPHTCLRAFWLPLHPQSDHSLFPERETRRRRRKTLPSAPIQT